MVIVSIIISLLVIYSIIYLTKHSNDLYRKLSNTDNYANNIKEYGKGYRNLTIYTSIIIFLSIIYTSSIGYLSYSYEKASNNIVTIDSNNIDNCLNRLESVDKERLLIEAIGYVESRNNPSCPGGGEMQITKICVDAANKLQNKVHYDYQDVYSKEKSIEIWKIIQSNYNKKGDIEHGIRLWNGGPGYKKESTQEYYEQVIRRYNYLIDNELDKICRQYKSLSYK